MSGRRTLFRRRRASRAQEADERQVAVLLEHWAALLEQRLVAVDAVAFEQPVHEVEAARDHDRIVQGLLVPPGVVDRLGVGLGDARRRFGYLPLVRLLRPAGSAAAE